MSLKHSLIDILDPSCPVVSEIEKADEDNAGAVFASFFRSWLDSSADKFFSIPYEVPENVYKLPGESDEAACDRIASGTLVSVGVPSAFGSVSNVDWHSNPTENGYKEWTWQLSRHNDIKLLAHEYLLTGNKKYATAAAALLSSWIDTCPVPGKDVVGSATDCWRTIECGIRMGANWPYIIYVFRNEFPDTLMCDIAISLSQHGERLQHNHMHGNWLLMEMNGLLHISVLFPFLKKAAEWNKFALDAMTAEAKRQFYPDGFQYELTTCYHEVAINNYQRMFELLKAFGLESPEALVSVMRKASEVDVLLMEGDGCLPDINDGTPSKVSTLLQPKERLFDSPLIKWAASEGKEGNPPDFTSIALPYSGFFVFRSGWGEDDIYALLDSAPFGRGHQHEDKLSLIASKGTRRVITEGGCYAYDDSPMRLHTISSMAHNVFLIDGMGQNRRKSYKWEDDEIEKLSDLSSGTGSDSDWAEGSYSGPYGENEEHPATWNRRVYFVKKHPNLKSAVLIVVDRVEGAEDHEYCLLWHVDSDRLSLSSHFALYDDVAIAFSAQGALSVTNGRMFPVGGYIATGKEMGMYKAVDRLEYRVNGKACRIVTAISFGDDLSSVEAGSGLSDKDIKLVVDGEEIIFSESQLRF